MFPLSATGETGKTPLMYLSNLQVLPGFILIYKYDEAVKLYQGHITKMVDISYAQELHKRGLCAQIRFYLRLLLIQALSPEL